ncbi:MAG: response regulator transcription factor [Roseburia sp.]|nr:response regulator transcription factor [Roseburia sp.]
MTILLVEDNESIILGVSYLLKEEGYDVLTAQSVTETEELLARKNPDLILLDISLPDGSGFQLCRAIRESRKLPIIFLTAREEEADVVRGLELGADDYIIKPFRNRELISRIKSVLRRSGRGASVLVCQGICLDTESGRVTCDGAEVMLTKLEYRILATMMGNLGKLFTREEILAGIWDISGNFVNDNTLSVTMKRIREKLGEKGKLIKTIRGIGYRMDK